MDPVSAPDPVPAANEVKPYQIHVSSKYLDLTKKKLELTRLPHERLLPKSREWEYGTPKSEIEPLIDFWLEQYSWRVQETHLNALPQFRTAFTVADASSPLRIHFIHITSPNPEAIPLLLIPTFPLSNLSLGALFPALTNPSSHSTQSFHLVVPSIPGLGFSDAFATDVPILASTAELFNSLMIRLGYEHYLASTTGSGSDSPANIDYYLARLVGDRYPKNCLGVHLIDPPFHVPKVTREPLMWTKFAIAKFFHAPIWGYSAEDFAALKRTTRRARRSIKPARDVSAAQGQKQKQVHGSVGILGLRLREPHTFAYALCDSPVGLLSLVCSALRQRSPEHLLTSTEIIDLTQLAWLPGPEAGALFLSDAMNEAQDLCRSPAPTSPLPLSTSRSRVAVTVFSSEDVNAPRYSCPAWGHAQHDVVSVQRVPGKGGLIVWERADVVAEGIRGLAREMLRTDKAKLIRRPLVQVVTTVPALSGGHDGDVAEDLPSPSQGLGTGIQDVESPDTVVALDMSMR